MIDNTWATPLIYRPLEHGIDLAIYAGTKYGHLFTSRDAGLSWEKEWREFSEITAVAWTPVKAPLGANPKSDH